MAFFKISTPMTLLFSEEITSANEWQNFRNSFSKSKNSKTNVESTSEKFSKTKKQFVISGIDTDKYRYDHVTILHSVNIEDNGYWITSDTEKFINSNNDSWMTDDLRKDAYTFIGGKDRKNGFAKVFEEHNQDPELAKGKVIDLVIRELPNTKTIAVELLIGTNKKHSDLINNINRGYYNAVSMGCTVEYCLCSICGNKAEESSQYCGHINGLKPINGTSICSDGKIRKVAELCKDSIFYDCSWVHNPADNGAFHQNVVIASTLDKTNKIINFNDGMKKVAHDHGFKKMGFMETQFNKVTDIINFAVDNNFPSKVVGKLSNLNLELSQRTINEIINSVK